MLNTLFLVYVISNSLSSIVSQDEGIKVKSLCEDPLIHSADRLVNKTVRVYRGPYYWELIGLPAETITVEGPFKIWNLNMGTFTINNALVTVLEGNDIGSTYKIEGQRYWAWDKDGKQFAGAGRGNFWDLIPVGGFEAAFHDGNKNDPNVVGFKGIYVYYFSTKDKVWTGDKKGHINGKNGENFPTDLTAAFSWPTEHPKDDYVVYLFKRKKFCKRTKFMKKGENCQWIDNKVLFGCPSVRAEPSVSEVTGTTQVQAQKPSGIESKTSTAIAVPQPQPSPVEPDPKPKTTRVASETTPRNSGYTYYPSLALISGLIYLSLRLIL